MLRAVGGLIGTRLRRLALTRDTLPPVATDFFLLPAVYAGFAIAFLVDSFFFVDEGDELAPALPGIALVADAAAVAVPIVPFIGQSRQIKTAVIRYKVFLSRIPSHSTHRFGSQHSKQPKPTLQL